jgi:hypothetical protein
VETSGSDARGRLLIALGAAVILAATVIAVVALGDGEEAASGSVASPECIKDWNGDPAATSYGRHNFNFHDYTGALVTFLDEAAREVEEAEGMCAVVFPSRVLDTEPFAAGQVIKGRRWVPITSLRGVELSRIGELQADAAQAPNTILDTTGKLTAN